MKIATWLLTYVVGLAVATWWLAGLSFEGAASGVEELQDKIVPLVVVAVIMGVVSLVVKPVVQLLSLPLIVLTLGLFLLVINALMLMLTGWIAEQLGFGFTVDGFLSALLGAIVVTVISWVVDLVVEEE